MNDTDVEKLYEAFILLCDYIEEKTENGCLDCPHNGVCFGMAGNDFAESLERIRKKVNVV